MLRDMEIGYMQWREVVKEELMEERVRHVKLHPSVNLKK